MHRVQTNKNGKKVKNVKEGIARPGDVSLVKAYMAEIGVADYPNESNKWWDHYTANGWKIGGKSPMRDWKAAVRNWARNIKQAVPVKGGTQRGEKCPHCNELAPNLEWHLNNYCLEKPRQNKGVDAN